MDDRQTLTRTELQRVIERASVIDERLARLSVEEVRGIALELGISEAALLESLREFECESKPAGPIWPEVAAFAAGGAALGWVHSALWGVGGLFGYSPTGAAITFAAIGAALLIRALFPARSRPHLTYQLDSLAAWTGLIAAVSAIRFWDFLPVFEAAVALAEGVLRFGGISAVLGGAVVAFRIWRRGGGTGSEMPDSHPKRSPGLLRRIRSWFDSLRRDRVRGHA